MGFIRIKAVKRELKYLHWRFRPRGGFVKCDRFDDEAGLTHQRCNLLSFLDFCHRRGAVAVLPEWALIGRHNGGRLLISDLSEYFDFDACTIHGDKLRYIKEPDLTAAGGAKIVSLGRLPRRFGLIYKHKRCPFRPPDAFECYLPHTPFIRETARSVAERLKAESATGGYSVIHVRRGDALWFYDIDEDTSCPRIAEVIRQLPQQPVYIMSDEEPGFFSPLKDEFGDRLRLFTDFPELAPIKSQDNYRLFSIECEILELAAHRVSSFKTKRPDYYHFHLSSIPGTR